MFVYTTLKLTKSKLGFFVTRYKPWQICKSNQYLQVGFGPGLYLTLRKTLVLISVRYDARKNTFCLLYANKLILQRVEDLIVYLKNIRGVSEK